MALLFAPASAQDIAFSLQLWEHLGYTPHPKQLDIHLDASRFRVIAAGRRGGKTVFASMEAIKVLAQPNTRTWIVGPTKDAARKVFREVWDRTIRSGHWHRAQGSSEREGRLVTDWGSTIEIRTTKEPDNLIGEGLDLLIWDEAAKVPTDSFWIYELRATLSDRRGRAIFISTPVGRNWFYRLWKKGDDTLAGEWSSYRYTSADNPYIHPEEILSAQGDLTEEAFDQEYLAEFTRFSGRVYKAFDPDGRHVFKIDEGDEFLFEDFYAGIDDGFRNPFAIVVAGDDGDDGLDCVAEAYESGLHEGEKVERISDLFSEYEISQAWCDPSAASLIDACQEAGLAVDPAPHGPVDAASLQKMQLKKWRIERVSARIARGAKDGTKPGLRFLRDLTNSIHEHDIYRYKDLPADREGDEEPVKKDDHAVDAVQYLVTGYESDRYSDDDLRGLAVGERESSRLR